MHIHLDRPSLDILPTIQPSMYAHFKMPPTMDAFEKKQFEMLLEQTSRMIDKHMKRMREVARRMREEL